MVQTMYQIRVAGVVPEGHLLDMRAVTLEPNQVQTVLYGVCDEAALFGLLARLRSLGIEIVEIHRVPHLMRDSDPGEAEDAAGGPEE